MMRKKRKESGIRFECQQCGGCCQGEPGYVFLSENDIKKISAYLNCSRKEFLKKYAKSVDFPMRTPYSLIEHDDGRCIFYENGCQIYPVRPVQCSTFPFWPIFMKNIDDFHNLVKDCPGYGKGRILTRKEILEQMDLYTKELIITTVNHNSEEENR